jgi:hypothetical protein
VALTFCRRHGFQIGTSAHADHGRHCLTLTRRVPPPIWPMWDLRRAHAPRVPPALLERCATWALFGAWQGPEAVAGLSSSESQSRVL